MNLIGNMGAFGFVLAILACDTLATKWYLDVAENPQHPNMCYDKKLNKYFNNGDSWRRPDSCERVSCAPGDESGVMSITGSTCPVSISLPNNCRMSSLTPEDKYPDCCPRVICNGEPNGGIALVG